MLKSKISLMFMLLLIGVFISTSAAAERKNQNLNLKIDNDTVVKDKIYSKIESNLLKEKSGAFVAQIQDQNRIKVVLELKGSDASYIKSLEDNGAVIEAVHKNLVQASVSSSKLQALSDLPFVNYVRSPLKPYKDVVSEGAGVINASLLHNKGFNGSGVKIAIIDLGFANYSSKLGTELPSSVTVKSFSADGITGGGEVHGTAVAEIVYDIAPNASLYLINFDTDVNFSLAVDYAISQDVDIISMSVGLLPGPFDGTGYIDEIVNNATSKGIVWVNSAGNYAQRHWEGNYIEKTIIFEGNTYYVQDFGGGDETNSFYAKAGDTIIAILSWNDWPHSDQDYDLYLANEDTMTIVRGSWTTQNGTQEPSEMFGYPVSISGQYGIIIRKYNATTPVNFELYTINHNLEYKVASSSLSLPADVQDVITVGATNWSNDVLEPFSSQGPTNDGRTKPDVVAPDGVSTSTYGTDNFYGTSASAPHVAGAAALLYQVNQSLSMNQLKQALESGAKDLGAPGKDNRFGAGRIDVYKSAEPYLPPDSITNLRNVSYASNYINWTWIDPIDTDFSHVIIYMDGSFRTNVSKSIQYYNATGFVPGTAHIISTRTVDTSGNINQTWINHIAATLSTGEMKGDVNRNGRRDTGDATLILRYIVGLPIPSQYMPILPNGDMNCNSRIDTGDATLVLRDIVNLPIPRCWK